MRANFSRAKLFLYGCVSFIVGIASASFSEGVFVADGLWFFGLAVGCAVTIILWRLFDNQAGKTAFFLFCLLFFLLGFWRYGISLPVSGPDKIWFYNGREAEFIGVVNRELDTRQNSVKLTVGARYIGTEREPSLPISGNVLITTKLYPRYNYGDILKIKCQLKQPEPIDDFYYDRYLAVQNIYSLCYNPQIEIFKGEARRASPLLNAIYSAILKLKSQLAGAMAAGLPEPANSLLQGMILNNRGELPEELKQSFSQAGITHIIAISGMNIAIISVIVINLLIIIGVSRRFALLLSAGALLIYLGLIGLPASAVRAGIMAFIAMLAVFLGRLHKLTNALVLAAALMLIINPKMLRDDVGFQLSFLALLSIIYVYPIFKDWFEKIIKAEKRWQAPLLKGVIDVIILTLAAQVLTLPVIALNFHQVSVVAPLVNVSVLFLLPFIMVSGLIAPLISLLLPSLAWLWFTPTYLTLAYMIWVAQTAVRLPLAYLEVEYVWAGWIILFYVLASGGIWWYNKQKRG